MEVRWFLQLVLCVGIVSSCGCAAPARLPEVDVSSVPLALGSLRVSKQVISWKSIRDRNVIMQASDYSCGAASLATLLSYYFGDPVSEAEVMTDMLLHLEPARRAAVIQEGFSLLDLQGFAERRGYRAAGVRMALPQITRLRGPVVLYLEPAASRHFAVLRGVREDRVYLADPVRGNLRLRIGQFAAEWPSGIALVLGKPGFGIPANTPLGLEAEPEFRPELSAAREGLYAVQSR